MKKLGFALALITVMLLLIPFAGPMALRPVTVLEVLTSSLPPSFSPFLYMFAHANIIHWAFNSWCLLMLHNILTLHRCMASYISASAFGLLWCVFAPASATPVLGFSAILFWFFGYLIPFWWRTNKMTVFILGLYLAAGMFIPHVAGSFHLTLALMGFAYYHCEGWVRRFLNFVFDE